MDKYFGLIQCNLYSVLLLFRTRLLITPNEPFWNVSEIIILVLCNKREAGSLKIVIFNTQMQFYRWYHNQLMPKLNAFWISGFSQSSRHCIYLINIQDRTSAHKNFLFCFKSSLYLIFQLNFSYAWLKKALVISKN